MGAHNPPRRTKYFFQISSLHGGVSGDLNALSFGFWNLIVGLRHPRSSSGRKALRARVRQKLLAKALTLNGDKPLKPLRFNIATVLLHPFSSRRRKQLRAELKAGALRSLERSVVGEPFLAKQKSVDAFLQSRLYSEIIARASRHEPLVSRAAKTKYVIFPPFHDSLHAAHEAIRERLPAGEFGTVICIPWLRMGGADRLACLLAAAVRSIRPDERVLMLRTDNPHMERPDWLPEGIAAVDVSGLLKLLPDDAAEYVFYAMLRGLAAKRIINVNSRVCWRVFARFGDRMAREFNLYAYLFCWDQTPKGEKVGYPREFFSATTPYLNALFTDSEYFRSELIRTYSPPQDVAGKMFVLFTPAADAAWPVPAQKLAQERRRPRPRVLWAGRFDRQKRFDIVIKIAAAAPDIDFLCWGSAVLDSPPRKTKLPPNLVLNPPYRTLEELPLADSDLWLFTSDWEGMPNIMIEVAARGAALVGTSVGGVSELLDEKTGWPVPAGSSVEVYVSTIRRALENAAERLDRAAALQKRATARYTFDVHNRALREIFDREKDSRCAFPQS